MSGADIVRPDELNNRDDFEKFEKSCYPNDENPEATVAYMAVQWGHLDLLKYALERESRPEDRTLKFLLYDAIKYGHLEIVKYLTENHNVNIDHEGSFYRWEVIRSGVTNGHLDIVKHFVEEGIKKNKQPDLKHSYHDFRSLLFHAVEHGREDVITYLTGKKKVFLTWVDEKKENVLFKALRKENLDFIKHVLDEEKVNIDINWRNDEGCTLVHLLIINFKSMKSAEKILGYLISEKHADLDIPLRKHRSKTPLLYAIAHLPFSIIKVLIDNGANLNKQDIHGHTALHWALFGNIERGLEICEYLCKHGANVNLENVRGKTPMTIALERLPQEGRILEACKLFIEHGVNLNSTDKRGNHFVHTTVIQNNLNFLDYLVREKQVDVNTPRETDNITPLHWAAFGFHFKVCKYLIEHGAKVDLENQRNETPLDMSLKQNKSYGEENTAEVWKLLLENGANVDWTDEIKGNKLVHIAVTRHNRRFLDYLVRDRNVDINIPRETDGWTPLHIAASQYDSEICKYLIEQGDRVDDKNKNGETPVDTAFTNADFSWENSKLMDTYIIFIERGASVNLTDNTGNQLVHTAAKRGRKSVLEFLIQLKGKGVDINAPRESDGWTPLHLAAFEHNSEICQYLIEHGSRVNQKDKTDKTPLDLTLTNYHTWSSEPQKITETSKVLIEHGANVKSTDEEGNQLVHNAALYDQKSFLEYLINDKKVNIDTPRKEDKWTPLHCAASECNLEICRYLIEHGAEVDKKNMEGQTPLDIVWRRLSIDKRKFKFKNPRMRKRDSDFYEYKNQMMTEISKLLIQHGARVDSTDERGNQLVHNVAKYGETSLLEYLIADKKVDINTPRESNYWTPLHCAAYEDQYKNCICLINHGANIEAKDKNEETFLQVAGWASRARLFDYLKKVSNTTRSRRNVMNHFLTLPQNSTYQESRYKSVAEPEDKNVKCFPSYDSSFQLQNFFSYLSLIVRYFVGASSHSSQIPRFPQSTSVILESRMESIAVNAVNFANFTDA